MPNWSELLNKDVILEASYPGNLGFAELCAFHKVATKDEEDEMNNIIEKEDWNGFKKLIARVLDIDLE